jgi:hypothetical protein
MYHINMVITNKRQKKNKNIFVDILDFGTNVVYLHYSPSSHKRT